VIDIDQSPIGRTPRSNPATYIKVFDEIRRLYQQLPDARTRGYKPGRFSFNVPGGRCAACEGNGSNRLEMDFLADVWVTCPVCEGRRFNRETLHVRFKGKSIADVLDMDIQQALEHFANLPKIAAMLQTLHDVGLDYMKLGQPSPTLSGGEAQRIKLARELVKRSTGRTLYILDEPTTGLHFEDVRKLLEVLHGFADAGNTVVVVEHNLDVVKTADWVIDLGPEGGAGGGRVVAAGAPEEIVQCADSYTGQALHRVLDARQTARGMGKGKRATRAAATVAPGSGRGRTDEITAITVRGARQHNLQGIDVDIPRDQLTVCCGPSGSGKTSLAMDTVYAEGQRRYVESLSAYARQFLAPIDKPKVEQITGLSPAIAIEQKNTSRSPRSTVGTITEIYDYLRILFARLGQPYCPDCDTAVGAQSADEIIEKVMSLAAGTRLYLMAPVERREPQRFDQLWDELRRSGFTRIRIDGQTYELESPPAIDHRRRHVVEVIVDRVIVRKERAENKSVAGDAGPRDAAGQSKSGDKSPHSKAPKAATSPRTPNAVRTADGTAYSARARIADSVEAALDLGHGVVHVAHVDDQRPETHWRVDRHSQHYACDRCGRSFEELSPHNFSFNSPLGWCPSCEGLGVQPGSSLGMLIPNPRRSIRDGAVSLWPLQEGGPKLLAQMLHALAQHAGFSLDTPFAELNPKHQRAVLHGTGDDWIAARVEPEAGAADSAAVRLTFQYKGLFPAIEEAARLSPTLRNRLDHLAAQVACSACDGSRLRQDAAAVRFQDRTIGQLGAMRLDDLLQFFHALKLTASQQRIAGDLLREVRDRLRFLVDVGLGYLTLSRSGPTLSGGEAQRIRLASQIGSGLTGVLYVLDEPTIGLHPRDNRRLLDALRRLRDLGNTLLLVEHDREVVESADCLLDFGPGAGEHGGRIVSRGAPAVVRRDQRSLTGSYLSGREAIAVPTNRRLAAVGPAPLSPGPSPSRRGEGGKKPIAPIGPIGPIDPPGGWLEIVGARHNNLKDLTVRLPLGTFICVTGVSGSGKSSLVNDILWNSLARRLHRARTQAGAHDAIRGLELLNKVINVDQEPIGFTPTSNPATYTAVFDLIRQLFAQLPDARVRGYAAARFSFNRPGGRCEPCGGAGVRCIEMHFLPDVWVECSTCQGQRYNPETLAVKYKGHSIADVLNLSVSAALALFAQVPKIRRVLQTLDDVGLGYIKLGQSAPTLSGGEAQRVKLAAELARPGTGRTLYILDEPTTGLHFDDVKKLLAVLHRLVDLGNTVLVIEHHMDVIKTADWLIDLGPEAGDEGGQVVAAGPPEVVAGTVASHTGRILSEVLARGPRGDRARYDPVAAEQELEQAAAEAQPEADAAAPWQVDGERWHTQDRTSRKGTPCRWEGGALTWVVDQVQKLGSFAPTDWGQESIVEIPSPRKSDGWFLHAYTREEWLLWLSFRVRRGRFTQEELDRRFGLKPLDEVPELPIYGRESRVRFWGHSGLWQHIALTVHWLREIDTREFRRFIVQAAESFHETVGRIHAAPKAMTPWLVLKEKWHLSRKGFASPPRWDAALLPQLVQCLAEAVPDARVEYAHQFRIYYRVPGIGRAWAWITTKLPDALLLSLSMPAGQFNLSHVEGLGAASELRNRSDTDVADIRFVEPADLKKADLRSFIAASYAAFRALRP
jgi:excinuclease ABC subunit A